MVLAMRLSPEPDTDPHGVHQPHGPALEVPCASPSIFRRRTVGVVVSMCGVKVPTSFLVSPLEGRITRFKGVVAVLSHGLEARTPPRRECRSQFRCFTPRLACRISPAGASSSGLKIW